MIRGVEREVVDRFLRTSAILATDAICTDGGDPPDFVCSEPRGRRVGIELTEWVHQRQIAASKPRHRARRSVATATVSVEILAGNVGRLQLFPKKQLPEAAVAKFQRQLLEWTQSVEQSWVTFADRTTLDQGVPVRDFKECQLLQEHLAQIDVFPRTDERRVRIDVFEGGGAFSTTSAVEALLTILSKKVRKYADLRESKLLDEFWLVIYYWQGYLHNSPYDSHGYGLREIAAQIHPIIRSDPGPFGRIYVYDVPKERIFQLSP